MFRCFSLFLFVKRGLSKILRHIRKTVKDLQVCRCPENSFTDNKEIASRKYGDVKFLSGASVNAP